MESSQHSRNLTSMQLDMVVLILQPYLWLIPFIRLLMLVLPPVIILSILVVKSYDLVKRGFKNQFLS